MPTSTLQGSDSVADPFLSPIVVEAADFAATRITDRSHLGKWRFWVDAYDVELGTARRAGSRLVMCVAPGEWLAVGDRPEVQDVVDLTHVRGAVRITGMGARSVLEHVCALDLTDQMTPDGAAARTLVAGVATEIVRDDLEGEPSYLLLMSRSFALSGWEALERAARLS